MPGLIVHEWIERSGGAEKVLEAMLDAFPEDDVFCLWNDDPYRFPNREITESWLARTSLRKRKSLALPFMPATWRNLNFAKSYDWTLASSHLFAHHAQISKPDTIIRRFVYAHTPARYLWTPELDARGAGIIPRLGAALLRPVDRRAAQLNTSVAANSLFVQQRITDTWNIESRVIYPPVDVARVQHVPTWSDSVHGDERRFVDQLPPRFLLGASRFVPYKRLDLVIRIGAEMGLPVVIAGAGPEEMRLRDLGQNAGVPVMFAIDPSDDLLFSLYQRTMAYVFPAIEDFGIMPVEAMAAGAPVLVNALGGASESVLDGVTGVHLQNFDRPTIDNALRSIESLDRDIIKKRAGEFSKERFVTQLQEWVRP